MLTYICVILIDFQAQRDAFVQNNRSVHCDTKQKVVVLKSLKKTVNAVKISVGKLSKGVGVHEFVRWDISVLICIKLYISIGDQESLLSYTDAPFMHRVFIMCGLWKKFEFT